MKRDEYEPAATPITMASAKYVVETPPNNKRAISTKNAVNDTLNDLAYV